MNRIREATSDDMEEIYMMGYDAWGEQIPVKKYINMCHASRKYRQGIWYVLEETTTNKLLSSLIVYELNHAGETIVKGIGSVATPLQLRQNGYASILIEKVVYDLKKNQNCDHIFLYSDIGVAFYRKLHFKEIPDSKQLYMDSICMYYAKDNNVNSIPCRIPDFF